MLPPHQKKLEHSSKAELQYSIDLIMSTPISSIPDDVDMPDLADVDDDLFPAADLPFVDRPAPVTTKAKEKTGYLTRYKDYIILLLSSAIALKVPLDSIRKQAPPQLFSLGDVPVRAMIILIAYVIAQQLVKNLL